MPTHDPRCRSVLALLLVRSARLHGYRASTCKELACDRSCEGTSTTAASEVNVRRMCALVPIHGSWITLAVPRTVGPNQRLCVSALSWSMRTLPVKAASNGRVATSSCRSRSRTHTTRGDHAAQLACFVVFDHRSVLYALTRIV
jgi:hypothetical protein